MNDPKPVKLQVSCLHIRHKMMFCDARHATPGMIDDTSDTRVFFCRHTQEVLGPDGEPVSPTACTRARDCYRSGD